MPYKNQAVTNNLFKNEDIFILKPGKSRGKNKKYIERCLSLLDSNQFTELY